MHIYKPAAKIGATADYVSGAVKREERAVVKEESTGITLGTIGRKRKATPEPEPERFEDDGSIKQRSLKHPRHISQWGAKCEFQ